MVSKLLNDASIQHEEISCEEHEDLVEQYHITHVPTVVVLHSDNSIKILNNIAEVKQWLSHLTQAKQ